MRHVKIVHVKITVKYDALGINNKREMCVRYNNGNIKVWRNYIPKEVDKFIKSARCIRQVADLFGEVTEYVV